MPIGMRVSPASSRSFSSSTEREASWSKAVVLFRARVPFISITLCTRADFPADRPLLKAIYSVAGASASSTWLSTEVPGAWAWRTPSTEATSSAWSRWARSWSLSSTEMRMAEEMLSR